jgi:hypothetical protein
MQEWERAGVFKEIYRVLLLYYDKRRGIQWKWTSLDTAIVKAPKGGAAQGRTPRIGRNRASNAIFSRMVAEYRCPP